jgi:hypothetical protein
MKTRRLLMVSMFLLAFALLSAKANADNGYSARLISPTAGQVLYPGQTVRVEWKSELPKIENVEFCEMEIFLSLDGGQTWPMVITPLLDPRARFFYWTVPNMPTNAAVLDIRFGCERWYPECYSPQTASTFVIKEATGQLY